MKLAKDFLTLDENQDFHKGLFDCEVLQQLILKIVEPDILLKNISYFKDEMENRIIGRKNKKKLVAKKKYF